MGLRSRNLTCNCVVVKQPSPDWEARLTAAVAQQVKHWRDERGWSAQQLADRCADVIGKPVPRNTITNLENRRRSTITLGEVLVLAAALEVPAVALMLPLGTAVSIEVLPDVEVPVTDALAWLQGDEAPGLPAPRAAASSLMALTRQHQRAERGLQVAMAVAEAERWDRSSPDRGRRVHESQEARADAYERLRDVRKAIRAAGFVPPAVPAGVERTVDRDQPEVLVAELRRVASGTEHHLRTHMRKIDEVHGRPDVNWSIYGEAEDAHHNLLWARQQIREAGEDPGPLPADLEWVERRVGRPHAFEGRRGPEDLQPGFRLNEPLAWHAPSEGGDA